jgi:hypothetical protein
MKKLILFFTGILFFAFITNAQSSLETQKNIFITKAKLNKELQKETFFLAKNLLRRVEECRKDYSREIKRAIRIKENNSNENFLKAKLLLGSAALLESEINQEILIITLSVDQLDDQNNVNTEKIKKVIDKICAIRKINNQLAKTLEKLLTS